MTTEPTRPAGTAPSPRPPAGVGADAGADAGHEIARAVAVLRAGGLVALPTETVYGLGADARNAEAVRRVFAVKGRPADHPLIVHLASADQLDDWARDVPPVARVLADAFWPGPLTLVLWRAPGVPDVVTGGRDTVAVRVPDHPVARALLERFGDGIAAPSANRFGRVSPTTAAHVRADLGADVDLVLDGGPCRVGVESTIVDLTGAEPEILRPGGVGLDRLTDAIGSAPHRWSGATPARAPGMLAAHYAPRAQVRVVTADGVTEAARVALASGRVVGVLAPGATDGLPVEVIELEPAGPGPDYARALYDRLRQADRLGIEVLLAVAPPDDDLGAAVADRLRRAEAGGGVTPT